MKQNLSVHFTFNFVVKCRNQLDCLWVSDETGDTICANVKKTEIYDPFGASTCSCYDSSKADSVTGRCQALTSAPPSLLGISALQNIQLAVKGITLYSLLYGYIEIHRSTQKSDYHVLLYCRAYTMVGICFRSHHIANSSSIVLCSCTILQAR